MRHPSGNETDFQPGQHKVTNTSSADVYRAVQRHNPTLVSLARYVAQLRRWAEFTENDSVEDRAQQYAYQLVARQLEGLLGDLAPMLMPEAVRRDAEHYQSTGPRGQERIRLMREQHPNLDWDVFESVAGAAHPVGSNAYWNGVYIRAQAALGGC
jgi:hypothetical protein